MGLAQSLRFSGKLLFGNVISLPTSLTFYVALKSGLQHLRLELLRALTGRNRSFLAVESDYSVVLMYRQDFGSRLVIGPEKASFQPLSSFFGNWP